MHFPTLNVNGCIHKPISQKGHYIAKIQNSKLDNIYVFPFKAMAIMGTCCFFHSYEC